MILKNPNTRVYTVNLFADYLVSKIQPNEESIFSIADCKNFLIIKGKTTQKEILDISSIIKEFNDKYSIEKPISHTIDLIEYDSALPTVKNIQFVLHKSQNCSYHSSQISKFLSDNTSFGFEGQPIEFTDDTLIITSEFPHGYSLNQGRSLYLYGKHIYYSLPSIRQTSMFIELSLEKNQDDDFIISLFNLDTLEYDKVLESAVLDVFDFDLSWVLSEMKKVDWSVELTNPLEEYSFIKERNKELIIF